MSATMTTALVIGIIAILWSQYGAGAGLLAIALAVIVFIATMCLAEEGNQTIDKTLSDD